MKAKLKAASNTTQIMKEILDEKKRGKKNLTQLRAKLNAVIGVKAALQNEKIATKEKEAEEKAISKVKKRAAKLEAAAEASKVSGPCKAGDCAAQAVKITKDKEKLDRAKAKLKEEEKD